MFIQQLINGLSIGSIYALMAVGYSLIYSLLNFTNFANSISITMGAYTVFFFLTYVCHNIYIGIILAMLVSGGIAMLIDKLAYSPLLRKNARRIYLLIAGLGVSTMCDYSVVILFTSRFHAYPVTFSVKPVNILGADIGQVDLVILGISMVALFLMQVLIQKTKVGLAVRSASYSLDATSIMGVNVHKLILIVFMLAGALAGLSGAFLGVKYTAYPTIGSLSNKAFISSVFGGLGSLPGAVLGAMLLGVGETMIAGYVSSSLRDVFSYGLLVIILIIRPVGLMGKVTEDKA